MSSGKNGEHPMVRGEQLILTLYLYLEKNKKNLPGHHMFNL